MSFLLRPSSRRRCLSALIISLAATTTSLTRAAGDLAPAPPPKAYEYSTYELAPELQGPQRPWRAKDVKQMILERAAREKQRRQIDTYYYRIGFTMSYPLPLTRRPRLEDLPAPLPGRPYPWLTWLAWDLEERWRILHAAWRQFGDREAGMLLQQELAALAGWDRIAEVNNSIGLASGHIAGCLALALADESKWDPQLLEQARRAAKTLLERDVWPWFEQQWRAEITRPEQLGNIPAIALVRSAQLARVVGSPHLPALDAKAKEFCQVWCRMRMEGHHTEGTAYDGYLLDSLTGWLEGFPQRAELLRGGSLAFLSQVEQWMDLTLPGRFDLHAPLGDVEPEMPFWVTPLLRLEGWYGWSDVAWFLPRFPLERMPAAGLVAALEQKFPAPTRVPPVAPHVLPNAVTLRTGWEREGLLAAVGLTRTTMGHLQADGGQLVIGWQGRFWITDPGYQQYRPGEEREYTLGPLAHSAPVIGGKVLSQRAARLELAETDARGRKHACVDLTACYKGLPKDAAVRRDVWLIEDAAGLAVVARDNLSGFGKDVEVSTSWLGGNHLGWAFVDGWARLTDGTHALWLGTVPGVLEAGKLTRHPGSRGPLTLTQTASLPEGQGTRWWVFWCEPKAGWTPPLLQVQDGALKIRTAGAGPAEWSVGN